MKAVIDTNCLIASIPTNNPEYWLYLAFRRKAFDWCISNEIMLEYEEIISNFYSPHTADLVTNDHHFDILKKVPFPIVEVVSLTKFQEIMGY